MDVKITVLLLELFTLMPTTRPAVPGTFFWRPRVALDLYTPTRETCDPDLSYCHLHRAPRYSNLLSAHVTPPSAPTQLYPSPPVARMLTQENIEKGTAVVIGGYSAGLTVAALAETGNTRTTYPHLHPSTASFYTNSYRWLLRYLDLVPEWIAGKTGNFLETHKVWNRRYYFLNAFVPDWLQKVLFFVNKEEWEKEEKTWRRYSKYAESTFGKFYKYPSKHFNNFNSMRFNYSVEKDSSSSN